MSQLGGVRHCCLWAVPAAMALLGATVAGCEYQDGSTPAARATSSAPVTNPLAGPPTKPAEVAVLEQGNRTKLDEVLGVPVPDTYLNVTEAISGRMTSYLTRDPCPHQAPMSSPQPASAPLTPDWSSASENPGTQAVRLTFPRRSRAPSLPAGLLTCTPVMSLSTSSTSARMDPPGGPVPSPMSASLLGSPKKETRSSRAAGGVR